MIPDYGRFLLQVISGDLVDRCYALRKAIHELTRDDTNDPPEKLDSSYNPGLKLANAVGVIGQALIVRIPEHDLVATFAALRDLNVLGDSVVESRPLINTEAPRTAKSHRRDPRIRLVVGSIIRSLRWRYHIESHQLAAPRRQDRNNNDCC